MCQQKPAYNIVTLTAWNNFCQILALGDCAKDIFTRIVLLVGRRSQCQSSWRKGVENSAKEVLNSVRTSWLVLGLLICTLIYENQGLEKSRNQSISNIIRLVAGLLGRSFRCLMVQYFNNFFKIPFTIIFIIFIILYFFIT